MSIHVQIKMNSAQKILLQRSLDKNGKAQKFLTHEIRRMSDPYVPMQSGTLKNTAIEEDNRIIYPQIYSKMQFYQNKGCGLRGAHWTRRAWVDHGDEIIKATAKFAGGHT